MARYVDGFVLPVPKKNLQAYRRMAQKAGNIWREHGALDYKECAGDDLNTKVVLYSMIHLRRDAVVPALRGMARVLGKHGRLLVGCHRGQQDLHADERFGQPVSLDATLFESAELAGYATEAGFDVEETVMRPPYECEVQMEKLSLLAVKRGV